MSTPLRNIFGNEIKVVAQPRQIDRQYAGFTGAHGVTGMHLGSRGYQIIIAGTLAATGGSYSAARAALQTIIDNLELYQFSLPDTYTHDGCTFSYVVFDRFSILPDAGDKWFHFTSTGYVTCRFICYARALI